MNTQDIILLQPKAKSQLDPVVAFALNCVRAVPQFYSSWKSSSCSIASYLAIVASVAIYDIVLTIVYASSLQFMEQNPAGRWLMGLDQLDQTFGTTPDLTLFLSMKTFGTLTVLGTMFGLVRWHSRIGHPVALGVSSCQLYLAIHLTFALP